MSGPGHGTRTTPKRKHNPAAQRWTHIAPCPYCEAAIGADCVTADGDVNSSVHTARVDAAHLRKRVGYDGS